MIAIYSYSNVNPSAKLQPESRCPELLANYCDMLLRKTPLSRKLTSDEIEVKLKEVVSYLITRLSLESVEIFIPFVQ